MTMTSPTKTAKNLKEGNRILIDEQTGVVDFVYKCHDQVHILVIVNGESQCRSFSKTDVLTIAP